MHYNDLAKKGRGGDTELRYVDGELSHVNPREALIIDKFGAKGEDIVKKIGSGTINPETGLREYHLWHDHGPHVKIGGSVGNFWESGKDYFEREAKEISEIWDENLPDLDLEENFGLKTGPTVSPEPFSFRGFEGDSDAWMGDSPYNLEGAYGVNPDSKHYPDLPSIEQILGYGREGTVGTDEKFSGIENIMEGRYGEGMSGLNQLLLNQMDKADVYGLTADMNPFQKHRIISILSKYGDLSNISIENRELLKGELLQGAHGTDKDANVENLIDAFQKGQEMINTKGLASDYYKDMAGIEKKLKSDLAAVQKSYVQTEKGDRYKNLLSGITTPSQGESIQDAYMRNRDKLITGADKQRDTVASGLETDFFDNLGLWQEDLWGE